MKRQLIRNLLSLAIVGGLVLAAWPLAQTGYARWNQRQLESQWEAAAKVAHNEPVRNKPKIARTPGATSKHVPKANPARPAVRPLPLTRITCPEIGLDAVVVQGQDEESLRRGPGHDPYSALPGEKGNCVIAAHRNLYGSHFYRIDEVLPGTVITLRTPDATYHYSVVQIFNVADTDTSIRRAPTDPNAPSMLTLFTCTIPRTATRVVVTAQQMGPDVPLS